MLHDPTARQQPLYLATVPTDAGGVVVLIWWPTDDAPARFVADLEQLPLDDLPSVLAQFMFAYVENTYFAKAWWDSLAKRLQARVASLACMPNPYYGGWGYIQDRLVPWQITSVTRNYEAA